MTSGAVEMGKISSPNYNQKRSGGATKFSPGGQGKERVASPVRVKSARLDSTEARRERPTSTRSTAGAGAGAGGQGEYGNRDYGDMI